MQNPRWNASFIPDLSGKNILITGANSGLGYASAKALAKKGARVILGCRSMKKAEQSILKIRAVVPKAELEGVSIELSDLQQVKKAAEELKKRFNHLDVLINNAGIMATSYGTTSQGFEQQFGVNHLGHFVLTAELFPLLCKSVSGRIVTVSSLAALKGKMDFVELRENKNYQPWAAYRRSKLANLMFMLELDRRIRENKLQLTSVAAHPGGSNTNLSEKTRSNPVTRLIGKAVILPLLPDADQGAWSQLYAATMPNVRGGQYYGPNGWRQYSGHPRLLELPQTIGTQDEWEKLWKVSEDMSASTFEVKCT